MNGPGLSNAVVRFHKEFEFGPGGDTSGEVRTERGAVSFEYGDVVGSGEVGEHGALHEAGAGAADL